MDNKQKLALRQFSEHTRELSERTREFSEAISNQVKTLRKSLEVSFILPEDIGRRINKTLEQLPDDLNILAQHGWYLSMLFTPAETYELARFLEKGHVRKAEKFMDDFLSNYIKLIEESLCSRFPTRIKSIKSGIRAHKRRDYYASIPIFLTQADGICVELTGIKLYSTKQGKPKLSEFVKQLPASDYSSIFLHPLLSQGLITANENIRSKFPGTINRHEILHGASLNYGTRGNSLRALSWINYIGEILYDTTNDKLRQT